jgi:hypothetical protein
MFTLQHAINGVLQLDAPYPDRDDAFRKANELWGQRKETARMLRISPSQCRVEFKILGEDGTAQDHHDVMQEIQHRPELRQPPKWRW